MSSQIDRAAEFLFPTEGSRTLNVKFLCGGAYHVSAENLAEQIVRAELQIRNSNSKLVADVDSALTRHA